MPEGFDISDGESLSKLVTIIQVLGIKVLILDNLGLINSKDENSHEMATVMGNMRRLADQGLCVIVVHHQRKSNGQTSRLGETLRGHSSIGASLDFSYFVSRREFSDTITVIPTKARFAPVEIFGAKFCYEWIPDSNKELQSAMFYSYNVEDEGSKAAGLIPVILFDSGEIPKTKLTAELMAKGISRKIANEAITDLEGKTIQLRKGPRNATLVSLLEDNTDYGTVKKIRQAVTAGTSRR